MADRRKDRLVLLTGASEGIGAAAAAAFVAGGDRVVGIARGRERLDEIAAGLGGRFVPLVADVADAAAMEGMARQVLARHGVPDVVVANAGIGLDARLAETTDDDLARVFEVNVAGVVRTIRPFLAGMTARRSGRILIVSSVVGKRGVPRYAAYAASKFALHGLADALRPELLPSGVTVGMLCPSSTRTRFRENLLRAGAGRRAMRLRRHTAESVARALVSMSRSRRRERVLTLEGKLAAWAGALVPGLVDRVLARMASPDPKAAPPVRGAGRRRGA